MKKLPVTHTYPRETHPCPLYCHPRPDFFNEEQQPGGLPNSNQTTTCTPATLAMLTMLYQHSSRKTFGDKAFHILQVRERKERVNRRMWDFQHCNCIDHLCCFDLASKRLNQINLGTDKVITGLCLGSPWIITDLCLGKMNDNWRIPDETARRSWLQPYLHLF